MNHSRDKDRPESLGGSESRYKSLFDNAAFGCAICRLIRDEAGRPSDYEHLEVNASTRQQTGIEPGEIIGKRASELVSAEEVEWLVERYGSVVDSGRPTGYEQHFPVYDRTLEVGAAALDGDLFALTFIDISERIRAEAELKRHRDHLEELVAERTEELRSMVNAMAGREVRMAELKEVVAKLRNQLEQAGMKPAADDPLSNV